MAKLYKCLPSEIMNIEDGYTSFCFNEACCNLQLRLMKEEEPYYKQIDSNGKVEQKHYSSFSELYKQNK